MGDACGGVLDWTTSWFDSRRSLRALRGGSWNLGAVFRCDFRGWYGPERRGPDVGFRYARSLP